MKTNIVILLAASLAAACDVCQRTAAATGQVVATHSAGAAKTPSANKGAASLVLHYTGDSPETLFFQETLKLKKAMTGYAKVVLLKHNQTESWLDLSEKDEKLADVKELPTKTNLKSYLKQLADEGYTIDLWIVGHGKDGKFQLSNGTYGSSSWMTDDEIRALPAAVGYAKLPIRMVWSTLCYGSTLNDAWVAAGAKVVAGARYTNFYPNQFGTFAEAWANGSTYQQAMNAADTAASRTVVQTYLAMVHAPAHNKDWGSCPLGSTVLGDKDCAENYFRTFWLGKNAWQSKMSGKENMNYASEKIFAGSKDVSTRSKLSWN